MMRRNKTTPPRKVKGRNGITTRIGLEAFRTGRGGQCKRQLPEVPVNDTLKIPFLKEFLVTSARTVSLAIACILVAAGVQAQPFSVSFDWSDLKPCTSGSPNRVTNPTYVIKGLPKGTTGIQFRLTDKNAPDFNHGGGWANIARDGTVAPGAFSYESPCPPNGPHLYEWTAEARAGAHGKILGRATFARKYP